MTSTNTVPFWAAGSMRATRPSTSPLRVSTTARWPISMSLACVSGIRSSALRRPGTATRARFVPDSDPLADLNRHDLQHAFKTGTHPQGVGLAPPQLVERPALGDPGLLGCQLRIGRARTDPEAFGLDAMAVGQFLGLHL